MSCFCQKRVSHVYKLFHQFTSFWNLLLCTLKQIIFSAMSAPWNKSLYPPCSFSILYKNHLFYFYLNQFNTRKMFYIVFLLRCYHANKMLWFLSWIFFSHVTQIKSNIKLELQDSGAGSYSIDYGSTSNYGKNDYWLYKSLL